jgi:small Trp-rich protein
MPLVIVGVLLLVAKMAEFGPFAGWSWWLVLAPFAAAVLWWRFADSTGWTQRRAMDRMDKRKEQRRDRALQALGLEHGSERRRTQSRQEAARRSNPNPIRDDAAAKSAAGPETTSRGDSRRDTLP